MRTCVIIILSNFILFISQRQQNRSFIIQIVVALLVILPIRYCIERVKPFKLVEKDPIWKTELISLRGKFEDKTVFMNFEHSIEGMFYTNYIFYNRKPYDGEIDLLEKKNYTVIVKPDN